MNNRHRGALVIACMLTATHAGDALAETRLARETPQVWAVTAAGATVSWFTSGDDVASELEYGITQAYGTRAKAESREWPLIKSGDRLRQHVVTLKDLQPNTKYFYRARAGETALTPSPGTTDADFHFVTAKSPSDSSPTTFIVVGDGGEGNKYQRAITYQMEQTPHDFVLHTGDVVYDKGTDAEWSLNYYPIYRNLIRNRPWFTSLGNHDYLGASALHVVAPKYAKAGKRVLTEKDVAEAPEKDPNALLFHPQASGKAEGYFENAILPDGPGKERYYSFDWGQVHVAVLDSNRAQTPGKPGDPQYKWLEEDLSRSKAAWKIVVFHHPMTSLGKPAYIYLVEGMVSLRRDWHPLFEKYGVDVVFAGHDHTYQRSLPITVNAETGAIPRCRTHHHRWRRA